MQVRIEIVLLSLVSNPHYKNTIDNFQRWQ